MPSSSETAVKEATAGRPDREAERGRKESEVVPAGDAPPRTLFLVPHDQVVLFPDLVAPVVVRDPLAKRTIEQASTQTDVLGFVLVREGFDPERVSEDAIHHVGCVARVIRTLRMPDDSLQVVARGIRRFRLERLLRKRPYLIARVEYPEETGGDSDESLALVRVAKGLVRKLLQSDESVPEEFRVAAANIESPRAMADFAAAYFVKDPGDRQELLETFDVRERLEKAVTHLTRDVGLMELGQRIQEQIRQRLEKQQRDFFLREQLKEIQKELGEAKDPKTAAVEKLREKLDAIELPEEVRRRVDEELERLELLPLESPEAGVVRNYLEWIAALPWDRSTEDRSDFRVAEKILRDSHYGLEEVKERVLEFLAVRKLKPDHRGPILCLVGPPGVGKTSLGRAIADCLGRKFVRVSLGGMRDEAEIRGHRRTYVGAAPGRILQALKSVGVNNPVFMLDELDKLGTDFRGDPSSALLEVLDPEQNERFSDHYLELPFDLSRVMFVATANTTATIPAPLLDRLEVIEIPGYTTNEKVGIASRYLVPRQLERHGLTASQLRFGRPALRELLHGWTREAGVRQLEQQIARICRKVATQAARGRKVRVRLAPKDLPRFLGPPRYQEIRALRPDRPGIAIGLAWTPVGGEALNVEVVAAPGSGQLVITGMLGNVMLESARIALSHVRSNAERLGFAPPRMKELDIHVHVPAGAVPKDGPSAGITIATALVSLFRGRRVKRGVAMTGELTLTGRVLPVGGLRNKILAAKRAGLRDVVLPAANRPDVEDLNEEAKRGMRFHFVDHFDEVVELALPARRRRS